MSKFVSGSQIEIDDALNAIADDFRIEGNTIQDGIPSPTNPVELCSVGIYNMFRNGQDFNPYNMVYESGSDLGTWRQITADDAASLNYKVQLRDENDNVLDQENLSTDVSGFVKIPFTYTQCHHITFGINGHTIDTLLSFNTENYDFEIGSKYYIGFFVSDKTQGQIAFIYCMLFKLDIDTPDYYLPVQIIYNRYALQIYVDNNKPIPLKRLRGIPTNLSEPLRSVNNSKDILRCDTTGKYIDRNTGRVILDGTENWSNQDGAGDTTTKMMFALRLQNIDANMPNRKALSNYFVNSDVSVQSSSVDVTGFNFNPAEEYSNYIYFKIDKAALPTEDVAGFKTWLGEHNVEVVYELGETVTETYSTALTSVPLFDGTNLISVISDVEANLLLTYENDISPSDKQSLLIGNAIILSKIIVKETGEILTERDAIKTWEISNERFIEDTSSFIGEWVAREINGELHNISDTFNLYDKHIEVWIGIVTFGNGITIHNYTDNNVNWYNMGDFYINEPKDDEVADNTKYQGLDLTVLANQVFDADYRSSMFQQSFNERIKSNNYMRAWELASYALEQCGMKLATVFFTNANQEITTNQFTGGDTIRDVLKAISKLAHGWCRTDNHNIVYIDEPSLEYTNIANTETLHPDNYYSLETTKEEYGPVNYIAIGMRYIEGQDSVISDAQSIEDNGLQDLYIMDNPILYTQELRDANAPTAANLFGLKFEQFKAETIGHPWLVPYKPIRIIDMEGNEHISYPFNVLLKYDGHIKTEIQAPAMKRETERKLEYPGTQYNTLRKMGITVDRHTGEISTLNSLTKATADGLEKITTEYEEIITDTYRKEEIRKIVSGVGVDGTVVTSVKTNSATFNEDGMLYERLGAETSTLINEVGVDVQNTNNQSIMFAGYVNDTNTNYPDYRRQTIVGTENIIVKNYLNVGDHSRIQNFGSGTAIYWRR